MNEENPSIKVRSLNRHRRLFVHHLLSLILSPAMTETKRVPMSLDDNDDVKRSIVPMSLEDDNNRQPIQADPGLSRDLQSALVDSYVDCHTVARTHIESMDFWTDKMMHGSAKLFDEIVPSRSDREAGLDFKIKFLHLKVKRKGAAAPRTRGHEYFPLCRWRRRPLSSKRRHHARTSHLYPTWRAKVDSEVPSPRCPCRRLCYGLPGNRGFERGVPPLGNSDYSQRQHIRVSIKPCGADAKAFETDIYAGRLLTMVHSRMCALSADGRAKVRIHRLILGFSNGCMFQSLELHRERRETKIGCQIGNGLAPVDLKDAADMDLDTFAYHMGECPWDKVKGGAPPLFKPAVHAYVVS